MAVKKVILIATGAGIAPFVSFLEQRACAQLSGGVYILWLQICAARLYINPNWIDIAQMECQLNSTRVFHEIARKKSYIQNRIEESRDKLREGCDL